MKGFIIEVCGPFACFTRPEMKVERVSYDVITPSAARAIFESILWKPPIIWRITKIEVLAPIRWFSVRRNEVGKIASHRSEGIFIEDERQQRAGLILRDVKYRLHGAFDYQPRTDGNPDETEAKYAGMFERRAFKGQCFNQPYLGCREFSCRFRLVTDDNMVSPTIDETRDLGWMLYDLNFSNPDNPHPMWFRPTLNNGVIHIPHPESEEVRQ